MELFVDLPLMFSRIAENVEVRYEQFLLMSPDPFDDRHPCEFMLLPIFLQGDLLAKSLPVAKLLVVSGCIPKRSRPKFQQSKLYELIVLQGIFLFGDFKVQLVCW